MSGNAAALPAKLEAHHAGAPGCAPLAGWAQCIPWCAPGVSGGRNAQAVAVLDGRYREQETLLWYPTYRIELATQLCTQQARFLSLT